MTSNLVLVDTSAWILALKRGADATAKRKIDGLLSENRVAITPMIYLELLGGVKSQGEFQRLKSRLEALQQIPLAKREWEEAAKLAFELRRKGRTFPYTDILICAAALLHKLLLLHADRHFDIMAEEVPLKVENMLAR
jgi:predicted nucleic acid-binding protein